MTTRTKTKTIVTLIALILATILAPAGAHAQDDYTHQPQIKQIFDAFECDAVQLGSIAPYRAPKIYLPSFLRGRPQAQPCALPYVGSIMLDGAEYSIIPVHRGTLPGFDSAPAAANLLNYDLSQTLTYTESQELFSGEPPADGRYTELRYAFAVKDAGGPVFAASPGQDEPIDGPANLRDVHNAHKAKTLDDWIKSGKLRSMALSGNTPLRIAPTTVAPARTMHQICPHLAHLPTFTVDLVGTHLVPDFQMGGTVIRIWVQMRSSREIADACPAIRLYTMVEGPTFFNLMGPELEMQLEGQTVIREIEWRQKIILQPLEAGGQAIEATAAFIATPHGQALIIYIVVIVAVGIIVPQVFVLILV